MGSTVTRGEVEATVDATGMNTFFGKTASLIQVTPAFVTLDSVTLALLAVLYIAEPPRGGSDRRWLLRTVATGDINCCITLNSCSESRCFQSLGVVNGDSSHSLKRCSTFIDSFLHFVYMYITCTYKKQSVEGMGHLAKVLLNIMLVLLGVSFVLCGICLAYLLIEKESFKQSISVRSHLMLIVTIIVLASVH
jgi:magnesium-transporting ATPase (P-type)